jgi:drug/metabolite transporter (DMT)-like permease
MEKENLGLGVTVGLISSLAFTIMAIFVQLTGPEIPIQEISFLRGLFAFIVLLPFIFKKIPSLFNKNAKYVWSRSIAGGIAVICYFWNTSTGGAAEAKALANTSPLFVAVFSYALYKERLNRTELIGLTVLLIGAFALMYKVVIEQSFITVLVGSIGALFTGIAYLSLKQASGKYSTRLIVFAFSCATMLTSYLAKTTDWSVPVGKNLVFLILVGALGLAGQLLLTLSHMYLKNAVASSLAILNMVFLVFYDLFWTKKVAFGLELGYYVLITIGIFIMTAMNKKKSIRK